MTDDYPNEIKQLEADRRGRINLGTEYGDETVRVAVIEVVNDGGDD